jgi:NAD(P)-dependent dehydrogenase (short-subunit alcohol dehydrogenase family)
MVDMRLDRLFALDGRTALITGGGTGIGFGMAEALGRQGARLILVGRRLTVLDAAAARLAALGIPAGTLVADLAAADGPDYVVESVGEAPDILVNAAGINLRQPFEDVTLDAFDEHMAIHLRAPFRLTQRFAPSMAQHGFGRIVMIASLQSVRAFPNSAPYGAAKGGVVQLTRAIAERWSEHGVTCNAIAPGFFPTPLTEAVFKDKDVAARRAAQTAIGRNGQLEDLFGATIFLASEASRYVTGQTLFVDGGFTAK